MGTHPLAGIYSDTDIEQSFFIVIEAVENVCLFNAARYQVHDETPGYMRKPRTGRCGAS